MTTINPLPQFYLLDLILVSPLLILFLFSLVPITLKVFFKKNNEIKAVTSLSLSVLGLFASLAIFVIFFGGSLLETSHYAFSKALVFDNYSVVGCIMVLSLAVLGLPYVLNHPSINKNYFSEFLFLILNSIIGLLVLVLSNDLIVSFIGLEMASLSLYMLITLNLEVKLSKEAAIKYFILGSFASAIFLYGISMVYGSVVILTDGQITTHLSDLKSVSAELITKDRLFLMGVVFILVGFGFKVALFPFHAWVPDVYQGASTPLSLYMSAAVKVGSVLAFLRLVSAHMIANSQPLIWVLQWTAILTMLFGSFGALRQRSVKRLLAYSSVTHSGFMLAGVLAFAIHQGNDLSFKALYLYLFAYGLFSVGTFGFLSLLETESELDLSLDRLKGLFYKKPYAATGLSFCFLGLAGIPPCLGFFTKFLLFYSITSTGMYWLLIWALINAVIAVYYYLLPIVYMFFYPQEESQWLELKSNEIQKNIFFFVSCISLIGGLLLPVFF